MRQRQSLPPTRGHGPESLCSPQLRVHLLRPRITRGDTHGICAAQASATVSCACPFLSNRTKPMTLGLENTVTWF